MRLAFGFLVAVVLSTAAPRGAPAATVEYGAPAGNLAAGHYHGLTYSAVLPSGRLVTPAGTSVVTGMNALGVALTPDGRYAIVTNDNDYQRETHSIVDVLATGGFSLAVIDTATMAVVDRYRSPTMTLFMGVAALRDPNDAGRVLVLASGGESNTIYAFTLDARGHLVPEARPTVAVAGPVDPAFGDRGHSFPSSIAVAANGRHAYVVNETADTVATIDTATRSLAGVQRSVGYFPIGIAIAGDRVVVSNEGLMRYGTRSAPTVAPPFATPPADLARASSLSFLRTAPDGVLSAAPQDAPPFVPNLAMDQAPDGVRVVGGAHPTAVVATANGAYAFVAMTNVDRIATVALGESPHVVGGTELRLFDRGPYGTQPSALALSADGSRLYVALTGINAVAVIDARDPLHLHRLGLIPTGWSPMAIALSADDRVLFVVNQKGFGHDAGFTGDLAIFADANAVWSTLQKIDLGRVKLNDATRATLAATRRIVPAAPVYPAAIRNVVLILQENKTFDSMLGDFGRGPADPAFVQYGASITPNLHALAQRYGVAGNFFADAEESDAGHQFVGAGIASVYSERTLSVKSGRRPLVNKNEDPEDYPRVGYVFHALARHGVSFRDYGDFVRVSGYDEGLAPDPKADDPHFGGVDDTDAPTQGLGGLFALDVPAPAILAGHVDLNYPGWNLRIRDERRANEFIRDYGALVAANAQPRFTYVWLPANHGGFGPNVPPLAEEVADGDRALGKIVAYLTHLPSWKNTAIVIEPDDAQASRDHVDEYRSYAVVVSPYAKPHFIGMRHLSTSSVLKTIDGIFRIPPLSLGDLLATDMSDFFAVTAPDFTPYQALPVARQTASVEGARIAALLARTDQSAADADPARSARIIILARDADALAQQRAAMRPGIYRQRQAALFERAAAVVPAPRLDASGGDDLGGRPRTPG